nr:clotting factor B-like [Penaeus vannamei]
MWVGRRLLSLLAIVVGSTLTFCAAQGINEECTLLSGGPGVCRKITECPEVAQFAHRREVKYCGTVGRVAIVCCPADSSSCSSTGDNGGIAAPAVNFECGLQATRTIPHPGGLPSRRRRSLAGQSIGIGASVFAGLVLGGITSRVSAWPWMALLGEKDSTNTPDWLCAGSLINDQWVLTAAHCFDSRNPDVVRLGEHDYDDPSETTHEDYAISQTVVYPHYVPEQAYHDLALIKLDRKVQIKDFIRPVCLPWNQRNPSRLVNSGVTVTGWGRTQSGGRRSSTLQEVELKVFPRPGAMCSTRNWYSSIEFGLLGSPERPCCWHYYRRQRRLSGRLWRPGRAPRMQAIHSGGSHLQGLRLRPSGLRRALRQRPTAVLSPVD